MSLIDEPGSVTRMNKRDQCLSAAGACPIDNLRCHCDVFELWSFSPTPSPQPLKFSDDQLLDLIIASWNDRQIPYSNRALPVRFAAGIAASRGGLRLGEIFNAFFGFVSP